MFVLLSSPPRSAHRGRPLRLDGQQPQGQQRCKYGTKEYWDAMYAGDGELPATEYSWYCGWDELEPFWDELVPDRSARVLVPGMGNDAAVAHLYDAGWRSIVAFDYSADAVRRAEALLRGREGVELLCADACDLPLAADAFDAVLDKGALDAVDIAGGDGLARAAAELARVVRPGGVAVSVSRVAEPHALERAFAPDAWEPLRDGTLHIAATGETTLDLAASLYAWRRRE